MQKPLGRAFLKQALSEGNVLYLLLHTIFKHYKIQPERNKIQNISIIAIYVTFITAFFTFFSFV